MMFSRVLYVLLLAAILQTHVSASHVNETPTAQITHLHTQKSTNGKPLAKEAKKGTKKESNIPPSSSVQQPASHDQQTTDGRHRQDPVVAFSAVCTKQMDYFPGTSVIFDDVITNEGGRYANNTGQFACLDDDVYVFTWALSGHNPISPGMRVIGRLNIGLDEIKFGPKSSFRNDNSALGTAEMGSLGQCRTSPPSAVTVVTEPWLENDTPVKLFQNLPGFSGFKLGRPEVVVGFVAELSEKTYKFPGDLIKFDRALQNYGNYYNEITGLFTCPDNFTYVFMVTTQCQDPDTPWSVSRLMMDDEQILMGPATYPVTQEHDSGSASITAITRCQQNKHVFVEASQAQDFPYNSYAPHLTSFTGFRVHGEGDDGVAFMAVLSSNFTPPEDNLPIIMDNVLLNIGKAYDSLSGSFVCPDTNFYMFSFTAVAEHVVRSSIRIDDDKIRQNRNTGLDIDGTSGSSTASVIVRCQPASRVHVQHEGSNFMYFADYTSFSGYKLPGQEVIDWF